MRGFSLVEMLLAMALLALLVGLGVASLRPQRDRAESQALAMEVAQELRLARDQALASGTPVAVVFPSNARSLPHAQSLCVLSGQNLPRVLRSPDYSDQYPRAVV
ncbi:MAG: GspH/FimT family protein, partial [Candidatus Eremiobacterota bacterium]